MKKILALTISSLLLSACGSSTVNETVNETVDVSNDKPSLSDISAVWDFSEVDEGVENKLYVEIKDTSELTIYSYFDGSIGIIFGDSFGESCYNQTSEIITDLGDGLFEISEGGSDYNTSKMSLSEDQLIITEVPDTASDTVPDTVSYPKSSLTETDFVPLCGDVYPSFNETLNSLLEYED